MNRFIILLICWSLIPAPIINAQEDETADVEGHFHMAQGYHAKGKLDEAIKELELALKEDPRHVDSNCELGVIYMGQGDYDKAIEQLKKTLELDPIFPKTHYALANAYARKPTPDVKSARKYLDEAIRLGYNTVPWFLDYMKRLEVQEGIISETPGVE